MQELAEDTIEKVNEPYNATVFDVKMEDGTYISVIAVPMGRNKDYPLAYRIIFMSPHRGILRMGSGELLKMRGVSAKGVPELNEEWARTVLEESIEWGDLEI